MRERQFDFSKPMPKLTEDDVKTQKILMQEMIEHPDPEVAQRLARYRDEMRRAKALERQRKWRNER